MDKNEQDSGQSKSNGANEQFMVEQSAELNRTNQPLVMKPRGSNRFPIIVHCHLRWDFVWQRPQQIFSRLAEWHPILFVEDPVFHGDSAPALEISQPQPNLVRVVPVLPLGMSTSGTHDGVVASMIESAMLSDPLLSNRFELAVQWFYSPMSAPAMLGKFGVRSVVYDCMDELANFRFAPADIATREDYLLSHSDIVFTGGYQLFKSKSRKHHNVHFHGCGVDVSHFGMARADGTRVPEALAELKGPIFGYFGVIDERLDYSLLEALARACPDAHVVMIGPLAKVEQSQLPDLPNLHWLGQRSYADLPSLVKGFDVCLMPFALNEATKYINPTKTLEYMAAAKPIVSTAVPDVVRNFTPIVTVARSTDEFIAAVRQAHVAPDPRQIASGLEKADASSWHSIIADMRHQVGKILVRPVMTSVQSAIPVAGA